MCAAGAAVHSEGLPTPLPSKNDETLRAIKEEKWAR